MSQNNIRVTPEVLQTRATECEKYAARVDEIHKELVTLAKNLEAEWEGNASKNFLEAFNGVVLPNFVKAKELLAGEKDGAAAKLRLKAQNFIDADK